MSNYYFLATILPPLKVGSPPEISSRELDFLLRQNLTPQDLAKISRLKQLVDLENMRAIWLKNPVRFGGNFDEQELEENLLLKQNLPPFVLDFLDRYKETSTRAQHFPELLHRFFDIAISQESGFLGKYLTFEWQWRLICTVLRAKALGRDFAIELQYENPENPFVAELLAQKDAALFHPPSEYEGLVALFKARKDAPLDLYQALSEWRFAHIEELIEWDNFSFERILGFIAQFEICGEWLELDKRKGLETIEQLIEEKADE